MDPKRKRIYIIIIVICAILSAGLLFWTYFLSGGSDQTLIDAHASLGTPTTGSQVAAEASGSPETGFLAPSVFPTTNAFGEEVLKSEAFTKLKPYTSVNVSGQLGRPDPFRSY